MRNFFAKRCGLRGCQGQQRAVVAAARQAMNLYRQAGQRIGQGDAV
jgi:hypothetical protein